VMYYGEQGDEAHLPFNFQLILLPWDARTVREAVDAYELALPNSAWPNWVLGNHDQPRIASRVGRAQARVANMLLLALRGTPTCYYGDEIAMRNVPVPVEMMQDPPARFDPAHSRDPYRTPMQWDASAGAGFTTGTPWLPLADDYTTVNVAAQQNDPRSMLALFGRLITLRRELPALTIGAYKAVAQNVDDVFAFERTHGDQKLLVLLNFGTDEHTLNLESSSTNATVLCSTHMDREGTVDLQRVTLRSDEGLMLRLD
jgi:alpha-glucosidase